jgi:hypothetical protein
MPKKKSVCRNLRAPGRTDRGRSAGRVPLEWVGREEGWAVGWAEGDPIGWEVGWREGCEVGWLLGLEEGGAVGTRLGR